MICMGDIGCTFLFVVSNLRLTKWNFFIDLQSKMLPPPSLSSSLLCVCHLLVEGESLGAIALSVSVSSFLCADRVIIYSL